MRPSNSFTGPIARRSSTSSVFILLIGALVLFAVIVPLVAPAVSAGNPKKLPEYKTVVLLRLLTPDPTVGVGEGEFAPEILGKKEFACSFYWQITLYRDGVALETKHLKHQNSFFRFHVGPPVPAGRYIAKVPRKKLRGQHGAVICSAATSKPVIVPQD